MEILIGFTVASFSNRILEQEERILGIKDTVEETDTSAKKAVKSKALLTQTIWKIRDTMKKWNLSIIGLEEWEETELKGPENVFRNIIEGYLPSLKKEKRKGKRDIQNIK